MVAFAYGRRRPTTHKYDGTSYMTAGIKNCPIVVGKFIPTMRIVGTFISKPCRNMTTSVFYNFLPLFQPNKEL